MRGLIKRCTKDQHIEILRAFPSDAEAAVKYTEVMQKDVSRQNVTYWRKIYLNNKGNRAATHRQMREMREFIKPEPDDDIGTDLDIPQQAKRILVIPDIHAPYQHPDTLAFLQAVRDSLNPDLVVNLGDECFPGDVEIMTETGWVPFREYSSDVKVLAVSDGGAAKYEYPVRKIQKSGTFEILERKHTLIRQRTTPKHNLVKVDPRTGEWHRREAWDTKGTHSWYIPRNCVAAEATKWRLSDDELRLLVAFQADGTFTKGAARFAFTKQRKAERLAELLAALQIPYSTHTVERGDLQYYIRVADVPAYLTKTFEEVLPVSGGALRQREVFLDELVHWDGTPVLGGVRYTSTSKKNLDFVQAVAVTSGKYAKCTYPYVDVRERTENTSLKSAKESRSTVSSVYCVTVSSGMILIRDAGHVSVVGNCDMHSLSFHDSDPNLDSAGTELEQAKAFLEDLHELFPNMLICHSNHGSMVFRKAKAHGIPVQMIKKYRDVLFPEHGAPGWSWKYGWRINTALGTVLFKHQASGDPLIDAAHNLCNLFTGHQHGDFDIRYAASSARLYWAARSGCLIDKDALAFAYGKHTRYKPVIGCSAVVDGQPVLIPMLLNADGRWVKELK